MDRFHKIMELLDKNSENIPEGDYLELVNTVAEIRQQVKPPPFLLDQNEPMAYPRPFVPFDDAEQERLRQFIDTLDAEWSETDNVEPEPEVEHQGYTFNTVPDIPLQAVVEQMPRDVYDRLVTSTGPVSTQVRHDEDGWWVDVNWPSGDTSSYPGGMHQPVEEENESWVNLMREIRNFQFSTPMEVD
jgi:hypothetical protein|tara:strand:+ start:2754 stop:3314 length:561 start_codon:yes stop_codon:yes gene_type:complete